MSETSRPQTLEEAAKPKFRRVVTGRSKNGCTTCKARRLKCDETFPECNRCIELYGKCSGYHRLAKKPRIFHARPRLLAPATISEGPSVVLHVFKNEFEHRYFQIFARDVAPRTTIAGEFNSAGVLTHLIPQACWHEPALRRAYITLGALHVGQRQELPNDLALRRTDTKKVYEYALKQYQQTIRAMRDVKDVRTALLSCILIFCIEISVRNVELAFRQVISGLKLLGHYDTDVSNKRVSGLEDDLIDAFRTLEIHTLNVTGFSTPRLYQEFCSRNPLPTEFSSVEEARKALEFNSLQLLYMRRRYLFLPEINLEPCKRDKFRQIWVGPGLWNPHDKARKNLGFLKSLHTVLAMDEQWFVAADRIWKSLDGSDGRDYYRMAGLRVVALYTRIMNEASVMSQSGFDRYLHQFQEMIYLIKKILKFWESKGLDPQQGELDTGVVIGLAIVGYTCRHRSTRKEAIEILRNANRQEGIYDSYMASVTTDYIRNIEERDSTGEFVPEENRVAVTGLWVDLQNRLLKTTWEACKNLPEKIEEEGFINW